MRLDFQQGDTIIEVLLAITVFSMVSVGAMTIMGQGTNAAQRALEITLVRQQIDAQAEALRAAHQAYTSAGANLESSTWSKITSGSNTPPATKAETGCPAPAVGAEQSFAMNPYTAEKLNGAWYRSMDDGNAPVFAQITTSDDDSSLVANGLWIERKQESATGAGSAQDFTIHSCWYGAGMGTTPLELKTLVRLYDPAS